jgi:hypothetical protein
LKTELCLLAEKYGTDKFIFYTPYYHELLKDRRQSVKRVLELGIGSPEVMQESLSRLPDPPKYTTGASLYMWRDYFPNAEIYALDRNPKILINEPRIQSRLFEQSRPDTYPVGIHWDLIVDDGSHEMADQLIAFKTLWPRLELGGIYIVEDIKPTSLPDILSMIPYRFDYQHFTRPDLPAGRNTADIVVIRNE